MVKKGGLDYRDRGVRIIRAIGLFAPLIIVVYGLLIIMGAVQSDHFAGYTGFLIFSFWWIALAVLQALMPPRTQTDLGWRLVAYHLAGGGYLLFVAGFDTPFVMFWVLLILASWFHFGGYGARLSLLWFVILAMLDSSFNFGNQSIVIDNSISTIAVVFVGLSVLYFVRSQQVEKSVLSRAQDRELLQRERLLTIINNLADAILSTDQAGTVHIYNASSLNLLDTNDNLTGRNIDDILHLTDTDGTTFKLSEALSTTRGVISRDDLLYSFDDGETMRLEVTYSPIRGSFSRHSTGTNDGYIIIMRDVTKAKSLEEERDEFISVVSHELRTPITIAEGTISNVQLMMERGTPKPEQLRSAVDMAHDQVTYLAKMVNDLSTLSRAERGVADTAEDIDVKAMVQELFKQYGPAAATKKLHFDLDTSSQLGTIHVSRLYIEELLQNFITNAIKYTTEGTVTLSAHQKAGQVTFAVKDSGIGISKSEQKKVFEKFYRSEDYRTRETGGTGLGLYVAAKLSRKLGCTISLVSRLNHGSTFSFSLPIIAEAKRSRRSDTST